MSATKMTTIGSPEFIKIESISPLVSKCEVKVFYLGKNRNHSEISKETAMSMAQTLPCCPIVGWYSEDYDDFRDHGQEMVINGDGIKFNTKTKPYGFIAPNTKVWFQDFEETDEYGRIDCRTYLMTEGYLWTEQYEEAKKIIGEGRPHSMELDEKTLKGFWSKDESCGIDFFIINDAIFSKLCILGEDVEPCFEGSTITAPDVSASFQQNEGFVKTLYTMIEELKELTFSLKEKGGNLMPTENQELQNAEVQAAAAPEFTEEEKNSENLGNVGTESFSENQNNTEEFAKKNDEEKKDDSKGEEKEDDSKSDDSGKKSDDETDGKKEDDDKEDDEDEKKKKFTLEEYALIESELNELKSKYASLEQENNSLKQFKAEVENKEKDALIKSFYMLSDEDKEDVIKNKANYTLDDIEKTLSVIYVKKKVDFSLGENKQEKEPATTFNLNSLQEEESIPAWLKAVDNFKKENI